MRVWCIPGTKRALNFHQDAWWGWLGILMQILLWLSPSFGSFDASWLQISCQGDKYSKHRELIQFSAQGLHQLPVWSGIKWKGNSVKAPQVWEEGEHSKPAAPEVLFSDSSISSSGQTESVPNSSKTGAKNSCLRLQNFLLS